MKTIPSDIHTHYTTAKLNGEAVVSLSVSEQPAGIIQAHPQSLFSIGLHPWHVDTNWQTLITEHLLQLLSCPQVVAIGETGLDRRRGGEWSMQLTAFIRQAELAAHAGKPLVLHCVKAFEEIIRLHKEAFSQEKWIIHGFRGKAEQASQLIHQGFYLSFGEHYHKEALQCCPTDRLFIETDESSVSIEELYMRAASLRGTTTDNLKTDVLQNVQKVFLAHNP